MPGLKGRFQKQEWQDQAMQMKLRTSHTMDAETNHRLGLPWANEHQLQCQLSVLCALYLFFKQ